MLHQHLKVANLIVSSVWHKFIETLRKGFYYQKNIHVIFKRLKLMANNVAITMKKTVEHIKYETMYFINCELHRCLSHTAQKYFTEFKFGFLRNAECHWIYYV